MEFNSYSLVLIAVLGLAILMVFNVYWTKAKVKNCIKDSFELEKHAKIVFWVIENKNLFSKWPKSPTTTAELIEAGVEYIGWELVVAIEDEEETLGFSEDDTPESILNELQSVIQEALRAFEKMSKTDRQNPEVKDRRMALAQIQDRISLEKRQMMRK